MKHPNILSIEGVAPELFEFCTVSQWMENGNILEYVGKHPGADRLQLVRFFDPLRCDPALIGSYQLINLTHGLDYLHNNEIVHGDLKSVRGTYPTTLLY
jgi:serine/threonine protein kinase